MTKYKQEVENKEADALSRKRANFSNLQNDGLTSYNITISLEL